MRRVARRHGFVDPLALFDRMREFAQPSEVGEPVELLRAGAAFHARGLINRAIQFNLDWVWPYWVERQFDPNDRSFIPRAFSFSHVNLTHRNWTAVGLPDVAEYPIVDPRGLLTPLLDGWSLDVWMFDETGRPLVLPSKARECDQAIHVHDQLSISTRVKDATAEVTSTVWMEKVGNTHYCVSRALASAPKGGYLAVAIRPYNPEGISFIDHIEWLANLKQFRVNDTHTVTLSRAPDRVVFSCYSSGDLLREVRGLRWEGGGVDQQEPRPTSIRCRAGMATALALFSCEQSVEMRIPLVAAHGRTGGLTSPTSPRVEPSTSPPSSWSAEVTGLAALRISNVLWQRLYDIAVRTVILHAPREVYPGPYTYKRFWYRDAAFILHALACIGGHARTRRALDVFPPGQLADGYFRSQEGEWDSNGEVLWILQRCFDLSGEAFPGPWLDMVERGARWIVRKRLGEGTAHPGLLPAGFSAEHLGLNDFYYWDDFWSVAGLRAAVRILSATRPKAAAEFSAISDEFLDTIVSSFTRSRAYHEHGTIPAAPDRRMDSGAIGSLAADYPLLIWPPGYPAIIRTAEWMLDHSFVAGGFFQNMIHSGINAYLTLHIAQVLLRAGDPRWPELVSRIAELASPTGQWPEAIHPQTLGGCMGDGQHVWAAAEWIMMVRSLFVLEEPNGLVIGRGLGIVEEEPVSFGPTATAFGPLTVSFARTQNGATLTINAQWRATEPAISIEVPGLRLSNREGNEYLLTPER